MPVTHEVASSSLVVPAIYEKISPLVGLIFLSKVVEKRGENSPQVVSNLPEFGEIFAESGGLLQKERYFFEAKSVDSFNAKISRQASSFPPLKRESVRALFIFDANNCIN